MQIGIDFGGTKIEAAALDGNGTILTRIRRANPGSYDEAVRAIRDLVRTIEATAGRRGTVGVGTPGSVSPTTGVMRNSNSLYLNGQRFREDLSEALMRDVRLANDANCFALSEAVDGAGAGSAVVFGAILGTGCGGGLVVGGKLVAGANGIGGEWGHNPLPWPSVQENPGPSCYCGQQGCLEQWISGSGLQRDYLLHARQPMNAVDIIAQARAGNDEAENAFDRFIGRLARALATMCNVVDPDVIVVGGGLSNVAEIYERLPGIIRAHVFSDAWTARIVPAQWGDSSGVRGAARLWSLDEALTRQDTAFVNPK